MMSRRIIERIRAHNWLAVLIDFLIVVLGVFVGLQVNDWHEAVQRERRTARVVEAVRRDLRDAYRVEETYAREVDAALAAFDLERKQGKLPPPVFMRFPGSDTPPKTVWEAVIQMQLGELIDPDLLFELGFYYDERNGLGAKFVRYTEFTESEILPRLKQDAEVFYTPDRSRLAPVFEVHMDRLRERREEIDVLNEWAKCLDRRLSRPRDKGPSCRPQLGYGVEMPGLPSGVDRPARD